jgi:hypothetical protein
VCALRRAGYDGVRVDGTLCLRGWPRAAQAAGAARCDAIIVVARVALLLLLLFIPAPARERSHTYTRGSSCMCAYLLVTLHHGNILLLRALLLPAAAAQSVLRCAALWGSLT